MWVVLRQQCQAFDLAMKRCRLHDGEVEEINHNDNARPSPVSNAPTRLRLRPCRRVWSCTQTASTTNDSAARTAGDIHR
ncbi:hypothetical protein Axi01nite_96520 [Actinoplanes xinjiangensis]|nr:hypothetical protein Axi01nite_96520 [Actinoplanes xinjiangensis]